MVVDFPGLQSHWITEWTAPVLRAMGSATVSRAGLCAVLSFETVIRARLERWRACPGAP